jgi:PAS domain S-box-containing protein
MSTSPATLQTLLAATPVDQFDVAVIATTWAGEIGYWNRSAERLYGWRAEDVLGRNIAEVTPAEVERDRAEDIMRSLQAGVPWEGEMRLHRQTGRVFDAFVADTPLPATAPSMCAVIGASGRLADREKVKARNALLRYELRRHLGALWTLPAEPLDPAGWSDTGAAAGTLDYYRCYLQDGQGSIRSMRDGQFASDAEAIRYAETWLSMLKAYRGAEIWNLGRLVATLQV